MRTLLSGFGLFLALAPSTLAADRYTWGNVAMEGGGFVSAVVPSRTQPGLVYARTDVGGAYRWDSVGGRWIPLMDAISQLDVGLYGTEAMALDPQDSRRLYILAGTSYFSGGKTVLFRSANYGATFDTVNVTSQIQAHGNGMGRQTGEKLAVDPQNGAILFCGSRTKGLFRSQDSGKSWTSVAGTATTAGSSIVNDNGISFVLFDPTSGKTAGGGTKTVYVGVAKSTTNLMVSQDGGATFAPVEGSPTGMMAMRAALSGKDLLITFSNGPGPHSVQGGSVWKFATGTGTWTNITPKEGDVYYGSGGQSYAHGFGGITVDPTDPSHLVLSTTNHYGGQYRTADGKEAWGDKIFVSKDGGANWTSVITFAANDGKSPNLDTDGNSWIAGHAIHWAGSIEFDPFQPKRVWVVSGNGVFRTDDISATLPVWTFRSKGLEETVPLDIVSIPGGPLVTAIGDYDGSRFLDITRSTPLHDPRIGTTHSLGYAPLNGSFLRSGQVTDYSTGVGITSEVMYLSRDTARTWTKVPTVKGVHGLVVLNADGSVFLHRPENGSVVHRSTNGGTSWTTVTGLDGQANYSRIVPDPVDPAVFYLLDQQGWILASTDSGATFAKRGRVSDDAKSLYQNSSMLIRTVPGKSGTLWIPLDQNQVWLSGGYSRNGLALSEDGGRTFVRFPSVDLSVSVGLGKAAPGASYPALYIWGAAGGGPVGIYSSTDKGASWTRINDDAHQFGGPGNGNFVVGDFNVYGRVYMSTVGRGLVYGEIAGSSSVGPGRAAASRGSIALRGDRLRLEVPAGTADPLLELRDASGRILSSRSLGGARSVELGSNRGVLVARLLSGTRVLATAVLARP